MKTYEEITNEAHKTIIRLAEAGYTIADLEMFAINVMGEKRVIEDTAKKRAAITDVLPEAAQENPGYFNHFDTE
jgi:hypothetical protein